MSNMHKPIMHSMHRAAYVSFGHVLRFMCPHLDLPIVSRPILRAKCFKHRWSMTTDKHDHAGHIGAAAGARPAMITYAFKARCTNTCTADSTSEIALRPC